MENYVYPKLSRYFIAKLAPLSGLASLLVIGLVLLLTRPVTAQTTPPLTVTPGSATACSGTSVTLTASGCPAGGALLWSTSQAGAVVVVSPVQTTAYQVVCSVTSTSVVTTTAVSGTITSGTATSGTATSGTVVVSTTALITNTVSTSATATIQVNPPISISATVGPVSCNRGSDGRVVINATGGTGGFQYQFNNTTFQDGQYLYGTDCRCLPRCRSRCAGLYNAGYRSGPATRRPDAHHHVGRSQMHGRNGRGNHRRSIGRERYLPLLSERYPPRKWHVLRSQG